MVKLKGKQSECFAVVEQSSTFRGLYSEHCLFVELRDKSSELFSCCGTFRGLQSE